MMSQHLSEEEMQIVAIGQQVAEAATMQHIESCTLCQEQLAVYKIIVSTINEQPNAAFNFDLSDTILQQLQPASAKKTLSLRVFIIAAFIVIPLYLFRKNFLLLTTGISTVFLLLSVVACIVIIGFKVFKLYQTHQRQIAQLNIAE